MSNKKEKYLKIDAIVLKVMKQGEINRFFTFISPTIGIEKATAFGASKSTSRFCSVIQPFTEARLFLTRSNKSGFYKLDDASNIIGNEFIKKNLDYYYLVNFFTEILLTCYFEELENKSYYYLLKYSMDILENENDVAKSFLFFISKFLILNGYNYQLFNCKKTGRECTNYFFYPSEGGVFSEEFFRSQHFDISRKAASLWEFFLNNRYTDLINIKIGPSLFSELAPILFFLIERIFEKKLKTVKYLRNSLCLTEK